MVRPRVCKTDLVQIAIAADSLFRALIVFRTLFAADSLFEPLRALTVFRTVFTHLSNLEEIRVFITYRLEFL